MKLIQGKIDCQHSKLAKQTALFERYLNVKGEMRGNSHKFVYDPARHHLMPGLQSLNESGNMRWIKSELPTKSTGYTMVCGDPNLRNFYVFLDHNQDVYIYGENSCRLVRLLKKKRQAFQSKQAILQKVRANDPQIKELQIAIASIDAKIASIVKAMHTESQKFVSCFDVAILPRFQSLKG